MAGSFAHIVHKGDARSGSVLLKVVNLSTRDVTIWRELADEDGGRWIRPINSQDEVEIDAYIQKQRRFDTDLWVIEIEDRDGRHFLTEKIDLS